MDCLRHAYHRLCGTLPAPPGEAAAPAPPVQARAGLPDGLARGLHLALQVQPARPLAPEDFLTVPPLTPADFRRTDPLAPQGDLPALVALEERVPGQIHLDPHGPRPAWARGAVAVRHDPRGRVRRVLTPASLAQQLADLPPQARLQARLAAIDQRLAVLRSRRTRRDLALAALRAPAAARDDISPAQTLENARRVGAQLALRDGLAQLAARAGGLALACALRPCAQEDSPCQPLLAGAGGVALLGAGLVFGTRLSEMLAKAFHLRRHPVLTHTALLVLPLALQLGLPLAAAWRTGRASVGLLVLIHLLNRHASTVVRDGLAQSLMGRLGSLKVVTPQGSRPDPQRVFQQVDPGRIARSATWYTVHSLLLLVGGRAAFERWIGRSGQAGFADGLRDGLGLVIASTLNEALDAYNGAIAQAEAALDHGLRLAYVPAQPLCGRWSGAPDYLGRWRNHASARYGMGLLTSDPWVFGAELSAPGSSMRTAFRVVGAMATGATTLRGYLVERSHRADRLAAEREETWIEHFTRASARAREDGLHGRIRASLVADVRRDWLGAAAGQTADPATVDAAIEAELGPTLDALAEMALQVEVAAAARSRPARSYDVFYGREDGIVTFEQVRSVTATPLPAARRRAEDRPPTATSLRDLTPGDALAVDGMALLFDGWAADDEEHKGAPRLPHHLVVTSDEEIRRLDWPQGQVRADGRWAYRIDRRQFDLAPAPRADSGLGLGPR